MAGICPASTPLTFDKSTSSFTGSAARKERMSRGTGVSGVLSGVAFTVLSRVFLFVLHVMYAHRTTLCIPRQYFLTVFDGGGKWAGNQETEMVKNSLAGVLHRA